MPTHAEEVAQAGLTGDVLAVSGIDHRDGTVSYADATGKVSRRPMGRWVAFNAFQMHSHVQSEIGRRRVYEANRLPDDEREAWEAKIRRELRADAVSTLTLYPERAFRVEQDRRSGAEPTTAAGRAETDAMLLALAPEWETAQDAYAAAIQRQIMVSDAAANIEPQPSRDRPHEEWLRLVQGWHERTGIEEVEAASGEALDVLCEIENRIAALPAASLAGLRLKARVAERNDEVAWPDELGTGLVRDLLAFTAGSDVDWNAPPPGFMASPAIEPMNFARIPQGLKIELERLHGVALAEFERRMASLREGQGDRLEREAAIHAELFPAPLTAAIDPDSAGAQVLAAEADLRPAPNLVDMLDLASASLDDLQAVRDIAERIGAVAYAHAWGPRCRDRTHPSGAPDFNAAGKLVQWIGDALTDVEGAAEKEARRRVPDNREDRETRLSMLAVSVIDNGDPEAIEELACELLAHAKVERGEG
ncbi:hypothetical protein [Methylobacterium sp. E-046]|uniref:hypothetical protein n=1 Tax=Methylobacterium sp. E-046 TaxID=2836576 RepID=UPI001FB8E78C|nr:hypothetical protein [Methylobacterium sp. E-046]MCJ2102798.1 hypothetical protein [Methylobacterium sp. E-046]